MSPARPLVPVGERSMPQPRSRPSGNCRRLVRFPFIVTAFLLLCCIPGCNRLDLSIRVTLGDAIHNGCGALTRPKSPHLRHDVLSIAARQPRDGALHTGSCWMAARARRRSDRWLRGGRNSRGNRCQDGCGCDAKDEVKFMDKTFTRTGRPSGRRSRFTQILCYDSSAETSGSACPSH